MLLDLGTLTLGTLDLAPIVFDDGHNQRELFVTGSAKVFVMGHDLLPQALGFDNLNRTIAARSILRCSSRKASAGRRRVACLLE